MADDDSPAKPKDSGADTPSDKPPAKPKDDGSDKPVTPGTEQPCCCDYVTVYLNSVEVKEATSGGFPIAGKYLVNDRVSVLCYTECATPPKNLKSWPRNHAPGQEVPTGETKYPHIELTEPIKPDSDCWLHCSVNVQVYKKSPGEEAIDNFTGLLGDIAKEAVKLKNIIAAFGANSPEAQAQEKHIDDMVHHLAGLWKDITRAGDYLMDEFGINFDGPLGCEEGLIKAFRNTPDAQEISDDQVQIPRDIHSHDGQWRLVFWVERTCKKKQKKKK